MSSPIGHSLAGYVIHTIRFRTFKPEGHRSLLLYIFMANAPDMDIIPGALMGKPNLFHHGISHSLGAGVLFSFVAAFLIGRKRNHYVRDFLICFGLYCSHLLLDYISADGRPPFGIPLFWPLSNEYFIFPYPVLPPIMHSGLDHATISQFLHGLFSIHNLCVVSLESAAMIPFLVIFLLVRMHRNRRHELRLKAK